MQIREDSLKRLWRLLSNRQESQSVQLSENFRLEEFLVSQTAARAGHTLDPSAAVVANLERLCALVLEPLRRRLGAVFITSGYRDEWLNSRVGGARDSAHLTGRAADIRLPGLSVTDCCLKIVDLELPFDKLIAEFSSWTHVQIAEQGKIPRFNILRVQTRRPRGVPRRVGLNDSQRSLGTVTYKHHGTYSSVGRQHTQPIKTATRRKCVFAFIP
ncbi:MAG: D-Ala-D-Ala carboxypeptidase family metallohydrolase [Gammaproteobacteria bacterium]